MNNIMVLTGNGHPELAKAVAGELGITLGDCYVSRFSDGETHVVINDNVRGKDIFIVQPTCNPTNDNFMELLILIDACKRASVRRVTAVLPYFGYARQDRKDRSRVPITAKLVANLLDRAGADRILTVDLHAGQIQGFFDIPLDHLYAVRVFADYFQSKNIKDLVVVAPDVGGTKMARAYAKRFNAGLAIVDKRRVSDVKAEAMHVMGDVNGKNVVMVDDIVATAGSLAEASAALRKNGAKDIYVAVTHAVLCGPALERLERSEIKEMVVTDTIPLPPEKKISKITQLSVAPLLAEAIKRINLDYSISELFES
ncbi:MAG: ribose-phosphate pyrophosphokinase [Candidatus Omnitrophica bacterium]|nr:ribose-phosphate pyrophosphokinase [Candidatus Omnitrophota bacterium]